MSDDDLIRRGDARNALYRVGYGASAAEKAIAALPAVTQPAPDAAAIREAAWREVADLIRGWRNDTPMTGEECSSPSSRRSPMTAPDLSPFAGSGVRDDHLSSM